MKKLGLFVIAIAAVVALVIGVSVTSANQEAEAVLTAVDATEPVETDEVTPVAAVTTVRRPNKAILLDDADGATEAATEAATEELTETEPETEPTTEAVVTSAPYRAPRVSSTTTTAATTEPAETTPQVKVTGDTSEAITITVPETSEPEEDVDTADDGFSVPATPAPETEPETDPAPSTTEPAPETTTEEEVVTTEPEPAATEHRHAEIWQGDYLYVFDDDIVEISFVFYDEGTYVDGRITKIA